MGDLNGCPHHNDTAPLPQANGSAMHSERVLASLVSDLSFWELGTIREDEVEEDPNKKFDRMKERIRHQQHTALTEPTVVEALAAAAAAAAAAAPAAPPSVVAAPIWKTAVDPSTGRTYYYDAITRKTQWEKPDEVRAEERRLKKEKRRQEMIFFEEMQQNIVASLARGELIPGVSRDQTSKPLPPKEPLQSSSLPPPNSSSSRIRTISAMNEKLLAEIHSDADNDVDHGSAMRATAPTTTRTMTVAPVLEGRPPLPNRRQHMPLPQDSMELSPDIGVTAKGLDCDALEGEHLLDEPILDVASSDSLPSILPSDSSSTQSSGAGSGGGHVRRNTGGTIYVQTTMENPDVKATITCVCGVIRAHILQAAKKPQSSPISVVNNSTATTPIVPVINYDIFRDDYEKPYRNDDPEVPSLAQIELFYHDFYVRSQMEHDTIIMSLIYVERLIKETNGVLTPAPHNWRSVLFACMALSSKVWDDLSMFNLDFSNVSIASGLSSFSLKRTNALELSVLRSLNFDVKVPASVYAKYYFLIRTMLIRSGLLQGADVPLRKEDASLLESRTLQYQDSKVARQDRRAHSVDWTCFGKETKESEPVLKDTVCLEQLVSMIR